MREGAAGDTGATGEVSEGSGRRAPDAAPRGALTGIDLVQQLVRVQLLARREDDHLEPPRHRLQKLL